MVKILKMQYLEPHTRIWRPRKLTYILYFISFQTHYCSKSNLIEFSLQLELRDHLGDLVEAGEILNLVDDGRHPRQIVVPGIQKSIDAPDIKLTATSK